MSKAYVACSREQKNLLNVTTIMFYSVLFWN